jgi:predicted MFS family arabinose efflux permease
MDAEPSYSPVAETATQQAPMHLRYFNLLRRNANFRRLWLAQLISEIGDWFYSLAVYDLLLQTTNSGKAVGWAIIIQLLPWFFMTPLAGHLADRFRRRPLMITADAVRAVVVLGLLLIRGASDVWLVYSLLAIEVLFASIFEPARNALLPNLTEPDEILAANAISSITWSTALAVGAALGGAVTALLGRRVAFVVNSVSFLISALLIQRIQMVETHHQVPPKPAEPVRAPQAAGSLTEGWDYLRRRPGIVTLVLAKTGMGMVGGMLLLLAYFGERIFPVAGYGALAMGLLYGVRGAGAAVGPLVGDHLTRGDQTRMWKSISVSFFIMAISYLAFSRAPNLALAALAIFIAQMGTSNIWVMSTALLQLNVADRFRGRVFALDFGLMMLAASVSNYVVGVGLDRPGIGARTMAAALGAVLFFPALLWPFAQRLWGNVAERNP